MAYPGSYREPPARSRHFAAPLGENLYIWGGESETEDNLSLRAEFARYDPLSEQWSKFPIDGNSLTPPGLTNGACTSSDKSFYTYGGFSTVSFQSSLTGSLFEFNAQSASWTQLSVGYSQSSFSPTMKYGCKMVHYEGKLVLFGGCSTYQTGYTNELHLFNLNTRIWSHLVVTGFAPPPSNYFSLTMIDKYRAVLFGGFINGLVKSNDVFTLDLERMHWQEIPVEGVRPAKRSSHAAVCLGIDGNHPQLLVLQGRSETYESMNDMWMLDLKSWEWNEVSLPQHFKQSRYGHCAAAFSLSKSRIKVVLFGGEKSSDYYLADTSILLFECDGKAVNSGWILIDHADHTQIGEAHHSTKQSLVLTLQERNEEQNATIREVEARVQEADVAITNMQRRLREAEERAEISEQRALNSARDAEASERRAVNLEIEARQTAERIAELERRVDEYQIQIQQARTHWVVKREEILFTGQKIGRGGWATVSIAKFRGVNVAAKSIHHEIISSYNRRLFRREMGVAARIRHPNLVQFIGATQEGPLVILTELFPTSLRKELEREDHCYMSPPMVASIGLDVARALNYLHLTQPDPLIHRDISSANVLLEPRPNGCWRAKVGDYGTVKLLQELNTVCPGNFIYAAPEATDPTKQSPAMDIFSFGVLLVEMLTGELPPLEERQELVTSIRHPHMLALVQRCLDRERERRPSATAIITQLET